MAKKKMIRIFTWQENPPKKTHLSGEKLEHDGNKPCHDSKPEVQGQLYERRLQVVSSGPQGQFVVEPDLGDQSGHHCAKQSPRYERLAVEASRKRILFFMVTRREINKESACG